MTDTKAVYRCSLCGKRQEQVELLIDGLGGVCTCDECVDLARETVRPPVLHPWRCYGVPLSAKS